MKVMLSTMLVLISAAVFGAGLTSVQINGNTYSNISKVYVGSAGRIIILYPGGGTGASADAVPTNFLASWNINQDALAGAKAAQSAATANELERAIENGRFREVDGVVYDTRKTIGWVTFSNVKVLQVLDDGVIIDTTPYSEDDHIALFVKHLPMVSDTDFITFTALPAGTYSYTNKRGNDRTIRAYDLGRICDRSEIPETVLSGKKSFDSIAVDGTPQTDVIASLPDGGNLKASGSGFFISADGYLITNYHVVKNALRVKVKNSDGVFSADVVKSDEKNDLALLKVSGQFKPLFISTNDAQLGDSVFTIGFPDIDLQGTQPKFTDGKISSLYGIKDDPSDYQISVPVQPGNSGGPLVDAGGNVEGVVVARLNDFAALRSMGSLPQNVNYAIKGKLLRDFLSDSTGINFATAKTATEKSSVVGNVQQAVAIVLVY